MSTDDHPVIPWLTEPRRAWLYRLLLAISALAVIYGLGTGDQAAGWVAVGSALLGTGTAAANTSTR